MLIAPSHPPALASAADDPASLALGRVLTGIAGVPKPLAGGALIAQLLGPAILAT